MIKFREYLFFLFLLCVSPACAFDGSLLLLLAKNVNNIESNQTECEHQLGKISSEWQNGTMWAIKSKSFII